MTRLNRPMVATDLGSDDLLEAAPAPSLRDAGTPRSSVGTRRSLPPNLFGDHGGLTFTLVLLVVVMSFSSEYFLTSTNLLNILRQVSCVGIIAFGMTFVIIAGEIDISVGSAMGFSGSLLGVLLVQDGWPLPLGVLGVLSVGTVVGILVGIVRVQFALPSFLVTLGLFNVLRGLAYLLTDSTPIVIPSESFASWGNGSIEGIPTPGLILIGVFLTCWFLATRTVFGRSVYAVGGNVEAARLSGIPVNRVRIIIFALTGMLAALSGILLTSQLGSANPSLGVGAEFDVITAVVIGGASLAGGRGSMVGTAIGVLLVGVLGNGMVLLGVDPNLQTVTRGVIVVLAVMISTRGTGLRLLRPRNRRTGHAAT
jgi:ribose/xylose/arabinose/galactoside ABC-type transport system permease subunit